MSEQKSIFRKVSLDRLSSPEQLDKLITVVSPIGWAAIISLALLILATVAWGYFGLISNKVSGSGVLLFSGGEATITSQTSGRVIDVSVRSGDYVESGQIIARIEQEDLERRIKQVKENITAVETLNVETLDLDIDSLNSEIYSEFVQLAGQIRSTRVLQEVQSKEAEKNEQDVVNRKEILTKQVGELQRQISTLKESILKQLEEELEKAKKRLEDGTVLFNAGAIPQNELDSYSEEVSRLEQKIEKRDFDSQLDGLQLQLTMAQTELLQLDTSYSEYIWGAYKQTDDQISALIEQFTQQQQVILQDYLKQLDELENQYSEDSLIVAKSSGIVSSLKIQSDDFVRLGDVLGNIVRDDLSSVNSDVLLYVPLDKGKLVESGMDVYVSPTTVKREEHGYIIGRVVSVSATSITQDRMMSILQNMQLVQAFSRDAAVLEVEVELLNNGNTISGYQWSTPKGSPFAIKSGTVCVGEIVVSNQRPIEKVVPFFKGLFQ